MNAKLLLKTIFLIVVLLLLVLMGMHNRSYINFTLTPLAERITISQPAAIMYFGFFAVGVLTGTVLTAGGGSTERAAGNQRANSRIGHFSFSALVLLIVVVLDSFTTTKAEGCLRRKQNGATKPISHCFPCST